MIILFQNTSFLKQFLSCNGCFRLFSKIKKGSRASFWCTFSAWFFHKNVPYLILYQWTKFQCHTLFLSQDIKQNVLLKLVSAIFYQIVIFQPFKNYEKCFSFHLKSFCIFVFPSLFPCQHLKVCDVIMCLNKNLITCFVWYLEKETRRDIETLSMNEY